ncbi:hypothetical protein RCT21_14690, partial [Escherichia marmotae]|nr:hypothetical protein [Escherichia marmotae]
PVSPQADDAVLPAVMTGINEYNCVLRSLPLYFGHTQYLPGIPHQDTEQSTGYHNDTSPIVLSSDTATTPAKVHC